MTPADVASLIIALTGLIGTLGTLYVSIANAQRLRVVHTLVNGQSEKLNSLTASASFAEGLLEGEKRPYTVGKSPTEPRGETPDTH